MARFILGSKPNINCASEFPEDLSQIYSTFSLIVAVNSRPDEISELSTAELPAGYIVQYHLLQFARIEPFYRDVILFFPNRYHQPRTSENKHSELRTGSPTKVRVVCC